MREPWGGAWPPGAAGLCRRHGRAARGVHVRGGAPGRPLKRVRGTLISTKQIVGPSDERKNVTCDSQNTAIIRNRLIASRLQRRSALPTVGTTLTAQRCAGSSVLPPPAAPACEQNHLPASDKKHFKLVRAFKRAASDALMFCCLAERDHTSCQTARTQSPPRAP